MGAMCDDAGAYSHCLLWRMHLTRDVEVLPLSRVHVGRAECSLHMHADNGIRMGVPDLLFPLLLICTQPQSSRNSLIGVVGVRDHATRPSLFLHSEIYTCRYRVHMYICTPDMQLHMQTYAQCCWFT